MFRQLRMAFTIATNRDAQWLRERLTGAMIYHRSNLRAVAAFARPLSSAPGPSGHRANANVDLRRPGCADAGLLRRFIGRPLEIMVKDYRSVDLNPSRW